jgi:7-carboxy-7-deazaguanine synthase
VVAFKASTVVITGGEPLKYNLDYLCSKIRQLNILTYLETSGSEPLSGKWDWICLSPKRNSPPVDSIYGIANELKVIIAKDIDLTWAEENAARVSKGCSLCLQPEWSRRKEITGTIIDYIGINQKWKLSLQVHKYIGIP